MSSNPAGELPPSWSKSELSGIADLIRGVSYKKEDASPSPSAGAVPLLRATNITGSSLTFDGLVHVPKHYVASGQLLRSGDIVIASSSGSKDLVGKAGQVLVEIDSLSFGAFCTVVRPVAEIHHRYLGYYFESPNYRGAIYDISAGSNINNIKSSELAEHAVPVAPAAEQVRITEKLEELLSDLDAGIAELKTAQRKLAQYRQSLLKAAVEGALTADWRAAHGQPQESGAELLQRVLSERRARWEQKQLAKFAEQGKTPPRGWQAKYPEPFAPNLTGLPPLSEGWVWASLGQLLESMTSGSRDWAPYYDRGACTFVMAQNVRPWRPDFTFRQLVDPPLNDRDRARSMIEKDDLLITIVGANTGQSCRVAQELEDHFVCQSVALLRATEKSMSEFLNAVLNSSGHGQRQFREMNYGAGRPHLSFEQIESVLVPMPPADEQEQILSVIEEGSRQMEAIEVEIAKALKQTAAQRKNLLKAAFAGQLVPQDPNDEPASDLLARIRAEREANSMKSIARKRGPKTKERA